MKTFITTVVLVVAVSFSTFATAPAGTQVPNKVQFLDVTLQLDRYAQRKVQEKVISLNRSATHYQLFLNRCNLYFPLMDAILKKEGVPLDFKYAALQESTLKGDAVSKTGATGYWQFKDFTAKEMGLIVNHNIDERSHVIASTAAAAQYMRKNYAKLGSWLTTLISHNMGLGGAQRKIGTAYNGKRMIELDRNTHPYVFFVLANKIAFEDALGKDRSQKVRVFQAKAGTKLSDIAKKTAISLATLQEHNHWLKRNTFPNDKAHYYVIIPVNDQDEKRIAKALNKKGIQQDESAFVFTKQSNSPAEQFSESSYDVEDRTKPVITKRKRVTIDNYSLNMVSANGIPAFVAESGQSPATVASFLDMSPRKLMRLNDLKLFKDELVPGKVYYIEKKKRRAKQETHVLQAGETLWDVAHAYGIRLKKLRKKNRLKKKAVPKAGRVLLLRKRLGRKEEPTYQFPTQRKRAIELVEREESEIRVWEKQENTPKAVAEPVVTSKPKVEEPLTTKTHTTQQKREPEGRAIPQNAIVHRTRKNETMATLSHRYRVNLRQLKAWNPMGSYADIPAGTPIIIGFKTQKERVNEIPNTYSEIGNSSTSFKIDKKYHVVQKGDTLYSISRKYNVPVEQIQKKNNKRNSSLSVGEKLFIE